MVNQNWRFLVTEERDAFFNMALDEALFLLCLKEKLPPVLRLYQWEKTSVSFGYSQKINNTIDLNSCKNKGIDVVRRITGGRAVLHGDDLTYSLCSSEDYYDILGKNVMETYERISRAFILVLKRFNIKGCWAKGVRKNFDEGENYDIKAPCFLSSSRYEINVNGKKLIGSAQRRFKEGFIQQGSFLIKRGEVDLIDLLADQNQKKTMKKILKENSVTFEELIGKGGHYPYLAWKALISLEELAEATREGFEKYFKVKLELKKLNRNEFELAKKLAVEKYRSPDWSLRS